VDNSQFHPGPPPPKKRKIKTRDRARGFQGGKAEEGVRTIVAQVFKKQGREQNKASADHPTYKVQKSTVKGQKDSSAYAL